MKLKKWNYKTHTYDEYNVPDVWNVKTFSTDMEEEVNCVQCGKKLLFGSCYTSLEVHTEMGFGYAVCEECYGKEWKRRRNQG